MGDPTPPSIPADAPQDVKDFFDCKGDKLVWKKGKVTWLGLPINPDVTFEDGPEPGTINIDVSVGMPPLGTTFTLRASVNADGELVVDTSNVPDLSGLGMGGPKDVDAAIKRINDWFKHNRKKLKRPILKRGEVTLEKTPIVWYNTAPATPPPTVPVEPIPPTTPLPPARMTPPAGETPPSTGGGWCSLLSLFLLASLVGVVALGSGIGFAFFGGQPAATAVAVLSPSPSPSPSSRASPTAKPSASATSGLQGYISGVCARVVHEDFGKFVSYIDWYMYWYGYDVDHFVLLISGTSDNVPIDLVYDPVDGSWKGRLGLHNAGPKGIIQLVAVLDDGRPIDITDELLQVLGINVLQVRYPEEDSFGTICPDN